jgi:hypothetical protein
MNYAVYMKSKSDPEYRVLLGLFLMKEDAEVFFKGKDWDNDGYSYHVEEVDSWEEWTKVRKLLA